MIEIKSPQWSKLPISLEFYRIYRNALVVNAIFTGLTNHGTTYIQRRVNASTYVHRHHE